MRVRIGFRRPTLRKRLAARTSWQRVLRQNMGLKAPRGWGWVTNPRRAAYNRIYNRTTRGCLVTLILWAGALSGLAASILVFMHSHAQ
jgi:hypothetical protein